jgi:peptidoglycan/xylan/chitin deacetylase (PgdA/CDA1 family)
MRDDILKAQAQIKRNLGATPEFFAYPYGEYNLALASIVTELGLIGFGQQSGAIGYHSNFSALPRFPASGQFSHLDTLSIKLLSLAFPAQFLPSADNPFSLIVQIILPH